MNRETRRGIAEVRAAEVNGRPGVTLHAIRPFVVDDYGSLWMPDTFDASLAERMPTLCWAHEWEDPLGPATGYRTGPEGPEVDFVFSDFDAVPSARRAHAQVSDGTIQDCSVGFSGAKRRDPTDEEIAKYPGIREVIYEATLDEISLVLRGAVPGAKVLAVRSARSGEVVDLTAVEEIARRVVAGEIDQATADEMARLLSAPPDTDPADADVDLPEDDGDADLPEDDGDADLPDEAAADVIAEAEDILNISR